MIRIVLLATVLVLTGCSSMERLVSTPTKNSSTHAGAYKLDLNKRSVHIFDPVAVGTIADSQKLQPRIDNLFVLLDDRDNTTLYRGVPKQIYLFEIFRRFNMTMPRANLRGGVFRLSNDAGSLVASAYSATEIQHKIDLQKPLASVGTTNLADAISKLTEIAVSVKGRTGLLIFTDWQNIGKDEIEAVARFRQRGEALAGFNVVPDVDAWSGSQNPYCVFAVGVGNTLSRSLFDQADVCGFSESADKIAQPRDMAYFVRKILYTTPADSDGDGIYDYMDACPNTPEGRMINPQGCLRFDEEEQ